MAGDTKESLPPPSGDAAVPDPSYEASRSSTENAGNPSDCQTGNQSDNPTDEQTDMPPGGNRRPHTPKREADLSGLLNGAEKHELSMLIAKITDGMQRQIYRVFDSTGVDTSKDSPPSFWSKLPSNLRDFTLGVGGAKEDSKASTKENIEPDKKANLEDLAHETVQKEEREALGTSLQELKKEALQSFRRWQVAVNRRVGDISVKNTNGPQRGQASGPAWKKGSKPGNQPSAPKGESLVPFQILDRIQFIYLDDAQTQAPQS
jgi:hypothetical protein